ncbi:MAG: NADH-quinone oxidoreductase subunit J [Candidatus Omnitrophica bacterium]|nr:NADH-quinone oxidoreductase subunit J [Candidatus Omnitrophota bacterium]
MPEPVGPLRVAAQAAFYVAAALTLAGAWFAVSARNLFRAAMGLAGALFGVAVLYLFLEAEFLAVAQLLIYVGAIVTLIIFGVMLTARIDDPAVRRWNRQAGLCAAAALAVGGGLCWGVLTQTWDTGPPTAPVPLAVLGRALVSVYLLPFELLSLLLLGALVGAIVIARRD